MGGCQNHGPFLGTLKIRGRIIVGTQKGTIILTTTHIYIYTYAWRVRSSGHLDFEGLGHGMPFSE